MARERRVRAMRRRRTRRVVLATLTMASATGWLVARASAGQAVEPSPVVLAAVFADGYLPQDADEAVQVWNVGAVAADLAGWSLTDGTGRATFPAGAVLPAGGRWWLARDAVAFGRSFGHRPQWSWGAPADEVGRLAALGGGPSLANGGDVVWLERAADEVADVLAYGTPRSMPLAGWIGPPVVAYRMGRVAADHQVLYRKLDPIGRVPLPDTDAATDWAADASDVANGRRVRFPGWRLEERLQPTRARERGGLEVALAPDALYSFLARHLSSARSAIDLEVYTFAHPGLAEVLVERLRAGVRVRLVVDGAPAGGVSFEERWCLARIAAAGGQVWWHDEGGAVGRRYRAMHAKLGLIDGRLVLLGSENPGLGAAPADDLTDGTAGRRGVMLAVESPAVAAWAQDILSADLDATTFVDLRPFQPRDPSRGAPAADYEPPRDGGGAGYWPIAPEPLRTAGGFDIELISAPENSLTPGTGLLGLLEQAGAGDEVLVAQLNEPVWWGGGAAEGPVALNPRVQAYLAAARRGARVRVLLDGYFDDPAAANGNAATVGYLTGIAGAEGLDLAARLGNPAGLGLHSKTVLAHLAGRSGGPVRHWVHVGSLNGSEVAHKANRETAIQIDSEAAHRYLAAVFAWDWAESGANAVYLPAVSLP